MRAVRACGLAVSALLCSAAAVPEGVSLFRGGIERRGGDGLIPDAVEAVWRFKAGGIVNCDTIPAGERVYAAAESGRLYCLDAADGDEIWRFDAQHDDLSTPAVAGGRIWFSSSLREYSVAGGELRREDRAVLYCLDAETGRKKRARTDTRGPGGIRRPALREGRTGGSSASTPARAPLWIPAGGAIRSSAAVADGKVVFGSDDRCVTASTPGAGGGCGRLT